MQCIDSILYYLGFCFVLYVFFSVMGMMLIYASKDQWIPEFEESMTTLSFKLTLFWYLPIALVRRIFKK
jgi:hypothetical protein